MSLRELLNVTQAYGTTLWGEAFVNVLRELEADTPEARAKLEAEKNRAGMQALSAVAALPRAGR